MRAGRPRSRGLALLCELYFDGKLFIRTRLWLSERSAEQTLGVPREGGGMIILVVGDCVRVGMNQVGLGCEMGDGVQADDDEQR
jgi:hypothetical protein